MTCELIRSNCVVRGTMKNMLTYSAYFRWSCWRLSEPLYLMLTQTLTLPVWLTLRAWTVCLNLISSGHTYVTCNTAEKPGHVRYKLNFLSQAQFSISNCFSQHPDFSFHIMRLFFFCTHHLQDLPARHAVQQGGLYVALLVSQPITF